MNQSLEEKFRTKYQLLRRQVNCTFTLPISFKMASA